MILILGFPPERQSFTEEEEGTSSHIWPCLSTLLLSLLIYDIDTLGEILARCTAESQEECVWRAGREIRREKHLLLLPLQLDNSLHVFLIGSSLDQLPFKSALKIFVLCGFSFLLLRLNCHEEGINLNRYKAHHTLFIISFNSEKE